MPWDIIARNTRTDRFNAVILPWHAAIPEKSISKTRAADATRVIPPTYLAERAIQRPGPPLIHRDPLFRLDKLPSLQFLTALRTRRDRLSNLRVGSRNLHLLEADYRRCTADRNDRCSSRLESSGTSINCETRVETSATVLSAELQGTREHVTWAQPALTSFPGSESGKLR